MKPFTKNLVACLIAGLACSGSSIAGTYTNNFTSTDPAGLTFVGSGLRADGSEFTPVIEDGHLVITYAENGLGGAAYLDDLDAGATVDSFTANFTVRIGGGSSTPADGWAFVFGNDLDGSIFGEEGPTTTGIVVSFDIYDNGGGEAPAIDIKVNGNTVGHKTLTIFEMLSDTFSPVAIQVNKNGTLNMSYKGNVIYTNLVLEGYAPIAGGRFAMAGRTGALNANQWIDDLSIKTTVSTGVSAPTIITQPVSATVAERSPVSFSVLPDGTPPFTYQWYSNNVAIPSATTQSYSIAATPFTANGSIYKVEISNGVGSITSSNAVLTVNKDTVAPTLVSAQGSDSFTSVFVTFSEPVTAASASVVGNYSISGLTVSSATPVSPTIVLLGTSPQTSGTVYTLTVNNIQDTASTPNTITAGSTATFTSYVDSKGFLKFEYWANITGTIVQGLLDDPRYQAGLPDTTSFLTAFTTRTIFPDDSHENYGARITGFVTPPTDGDYRFFVSSDDSSQLFLSADENPANLSGVPIAEEPGCCNAFSEPDGLHTRTSEPIVLKGGQRYYVMFLLKEGGGGDYGMVAWRKEGDTTPASSLQPIPASFISAYADPGLVSINFTKQPADTTEAENTTGTFTVGVTASPAPVAYQWQRASAGSPTFTNIPGAISATYVTPVLKQSVDNGAKYRAVVSVPGGSSNSAPATLTVIIDSTAPTLSAAKGTVDFKGVKLTFSEEMDVTSAVVPANYSIPGLTVSAATLVAPDTIQLTTSPQTEKTAYTVTISNVKDSAGNLIDPAGSSKTFTSLVTVSNTVLFEVYTGIGGTAVQDLKNSSKYPDKPDYSTLLGSFSSPSGFGDNYGAKISGFVIPKTTGQYRFFVYSDDSSQLFLSTSDSPAGLSALPIAEEPSCCNPFSEPDGVQTRTSEPITLQANQKYYISFLFKEGGGGDFGSVAWRLEGDPTPADQLLPISPTNLVAVVDPAVLQSLSLPASVATPVGSGDTAAPGFKVRISQVDPKGTTGVATIISAAEQSLAGLIGTNSADLTLAQNGIFNIPTTINWNQEVGVGGTGVEIGSFQSTFDPSRPDGPIPGIPGFGTVAYNLDNIAAEVIGYVEFPTPGLYFLGVNSDDGFKMTATDKPPTNNLSLVVKNTAAAGSYYAVTGGTDVAGVFRPITNAITGKLVYAQPPDGCTPITNTNEIKGNIALIDRGVCTFSAKVQAALDAGAIAVVIVNSRDPGAADGILPIVMGGTVVDLPATMITKPDGAKIKGSIADGMMVSITPDATPALGQFNGGRGSADSIFAVNVPQAGLYPLRTIWFEGGGGANLEIFSVTSTGQKILLNDRANPSALKSYRARAGSNPPVMSISSSGAQIIITWTNGGTLESSLTVSGGYAPVANASSPYSVSPADAARFYRVRQ